MAHLRRYLTLLIAGALGLVSTHAAQPGKQAPSFALVALADFPGRDQLYHLRSDTDAEPVEIAVLQRAQPIEAKSTSGNIVLGARQTDAATGRTTYRPVVQVAWPAGAPDRVIVFLAPGADGRLAAVAIDDSLRTFPARTLRVINFSGETLVGKFGGFQGTITPGPQGAVAYPAVEAPAGTTGRFRVGIGREDAAGNAKLVFNGWTEAWPNGRTLLLIRKEGTRIQVRSLVETLSEPQA